MRGSLEEIGCHVRSDEDANDARITVVAPAGETVYFMVSAWSVVVHLDVAEPPPANDQIDNATVIGSLPFEDSPEASGASVEPGDPAVSAPCELEVPLEQTLWYSFTSADEIALRARAMDPGSFDGYRRARGLFGGIRAPRSTRLLPSRTTPPNSSRRSLAFAFPRGSASGSWWVWRTLQPESSRFRSRSLPHHPRTMTSTTLCSIESLPFETSLDMFSATSAPDDPVPHADSAFRRLGSPSKLSTVREWRSNSCSVE